MNKDFTLNGLDFSPEINLARYLQSIRKFPILTPENEYDLAVKYKATHDPKIAQQLINSHLRLVVKVVSKYKGYGLPVSEMISEGNIGLLYAINKFEPEKGFRFSTYALWWIKASIQKYILNSWSLVKNRLNLKDDRELSHDVLGGIAASLDVSVQEVTDMNMRLKAHDGSLNAVIDSSSDNGSEWIDFISDSKPNQEEKLAYSETMAYRKRLFNQALGCLNPREKDILFKRRLVDKSVTLDDLSKTYDISKERVRQIELNSIKKIRKAIFAEN